MDYSITALDGTRTTIVDNHDGTITRTVFAADGTTVETETIGGQPVTPPFPPLDPTGCIATLMVVNGGNPVDWSNVAGTVPAHLEHEALAWSVAAS